MLSSNDARNRKTKGKPDPLSEIESVMEDDSTSPIRDDLAPETFKGDAKMSSEEQPLRTPMMKEREVAPKVSTKSNRKSKANQQPIIMVAMPTISEIHEVGVDYIVVAGSTGAEKLRANARPVTSGTSYVNYNGELYYVPKKDKITLEFQPMPTTALVAEERHDYQALTTEDMSELLITRANETSMNYLIILQKGVPQRIEQLPFAGNTISLTTRVYEEVLNVPASESETLEATDFDEEDDEAIPLIAESDAPLITLKKVDYDTIRTSTHIKTTDSNLYDSTHAFSVGTLDVKVTITTFGIGEITREFKLRGVRQSDLSYIQTSTLMANLEAGEVYDFIQWSTHGRAVRQLWESLANDFHLNVNELIDRSKGLTYNQVSSILRCPKA